MRDFLKKRIPTIIGIVLLLSGAVTGIVLVSQETGFLPRAAPEFAPQELTVTNISDNSFTISWTTQQNTIGFLKYGTSPSTLNETKQDDRTEFTTTQGEYQTHHITIRNLDPETIYYFRVGSGGSNQLYDNSGQPYTVTTAPGLNTPPAADTAYGQVVNSADTPVEGAIVYINLPNAARLSTITKNAGQWAISLSNARDQSLNNYASYDPETSSMDLLIKGPAGQSSRVITTTGNDQPVPNVTLGQDYDFTDQLSESGDNATESATVEATTESGFDLSPIGEVTEATEELTILNPSDEGEAVNTTQPEFKGTAPAGTTLTITVNSSHEIVDTVTVSPNNTWSWSPPQNLEPGSHEITVQFTDGNGILQTITRSFVVYAAGESQDPAFSATPSATPVPTPTPASSPSARVTQPSTQSGVPQPGTGTPSLVIFILGIIMVSSGFLYRKSF